MGTGFTIDSPLRVGRFGIDSVMSLGDDNLLEECRRYHSELNKLPFVAIAPEEVDARARRIQAWLDLVDRLLKAQIEEVRNAPLQEGSLLDRYFRLMPPGEARSAWERARTLPAGADRDAAAAALRPLVHAGSPDVNIMTKVDRSTDRSGKPFPPGGSDTQAALRGFANSSISSGLVFSAGLNPRLYGMMAELPGFLPDPEGGAPTKRVILKVSDLRSAEIQGRFLAKKGIWISEFRFESGLNCGGHAFAAEGQLLPLALDEFAKRRAELSDELFNACQKSLAGHGKPIFRERPAQKLSAQGGVGTVIEQRYMLERFGVDSVGWGTPFLLVPEATLVDDEHLELLEKAGEDDVHLSENSPLGIPFWALKTSHSERVRKERIAAGRPGSPCPQAYLLFNNQYTKHPICEASRGFQQLRLKALERSDLSATAKAALSSRALEKACICADLAGGAVKRLGLKGSQLGSVCTGPNIAYFSKRVSLEEMLDHIYGRLDLLKGVERPHQFLKELRLNVEYLRKRWDELNAGWGRDREADLRAFAANLRKAIELLEQLFVEAPSSFGAAFQRGLDALRKELESHPALAAVPV